MSDKKHIDRLFQEGFKDFEATPPPEVWEGIQAALKKEEKEDRKIIPIWWRAAGVAALLALLFLAGSIWWPENSGSDSLTDQQVVPVDSDESKSDTQTKTLLDKAVEDQPEEIANQDNEPAEQQGENADKTPAESKMRNANSREAVAAQQQELLKTQQNNRVNKNAVDKTLDAVREGVAVNTDAQKEKNGEGVSNADQQTDRTKTEVDNPKLVDEKTAEALIESKTQTAVAINDDPKANADKEENTTEDQKQIDAFSEEGKISLLEYIKDQETADKDDEALALEQQNDIDDRWSVAPQVAPVFYGSLSDGSPVGQEFADNTTSSDANLSYGVQVQYQVNDRFSVRSGVNRVNLSYNTNDIEFAVAPTSANVGTKFVNGNVSYAVGDKGTLNDRFAQAVPTDGFDLQQVDAFEGLLNQRFEYWEVPLEVSYALLNKRFKLNLLGGFSTLILQDNSLTAISGPRETNLGSLDNLNDLSFTTNIGLGFQYNISKRFAVNVEPVFKYQLNPYADSSIGSQPYYMGVYSGLRFKF